MWQNRSPKFGKSGSRTFTYSFLSLKQVKLQQRVTHFFLHLALLYVLWCYWQVALWKSVHSNDPPQKKILAEFEMWQYPVLFGIDNACTINLHNIAQNHQTITRTWVAWQPQKILHRFSPNFVDQLLLTFVQVGCACAPRTQSAMLYMINDLLFWSETGLVYFVKFVSCPRLMIEVPLTAFRTEALTLTTISDL